MKKILAVALLDWRRLAFGLVPAALIAGLIPSLSDGIGEPIPVASVLVALFLLVGAACGGYFGTDFAEGRSSFFFARPLPTRALITGRATALLVLAGVAFLAFMASNWISSTEANWTAWILEKRHAYALVVAWSVSLFVSLGIAARARDSRGRSGMRDAIVIPLRLSASIAAFFLMFGLFADLVLRAYAESFRPIELFLWSWAIASLVASFVAIASGRTERLRIARLQSLVMGVHFVLVSLVVASAWSYVLHPGPEAIEKVVAWGSASADGRTALVATVVNRGDGKTPVPIFVLDIASGQAVRLNADKHDGPWASADGSTVVWSEATPFFFRPLWRRLGGETTFRVRSASGEIRPLPMPSQAPDYRTARDLSRYGGVINWVLPSPDGDTFAILWDRHLTFTSHTRGELSDTPFGGGDRPFVRRTALFRRSGDFRIAVGRRDAAGTQSLEFVDIEPKSGALKVLFSMKAENLGLVLFDSTGDRALVTSGYQPGRVGSILLVDLSGSPGEVKTTTLPGEVFFPTARFMTDGGIVVSGRSALAAPYETSLTVLSPDGKPVLSIPTPLGYSGYMGAEMFPGVVAMTSGAPEVATTLVDTITGKILRRIPGLRSQNALMGSPPPGSATARLLHSADGKLYEMPSLDAAPRLLLPLTRP